MADADDLATLRDYLAARLACHHDPGTLPVCRYCTALATHRYLKESRMFCCDAHVADFDACDLERLPEADLAPRVDALLGSVHARPVVALDGHWRPVLGCPVGSGAACLCTADPCASLAAPLCLDDSDCDSAATLINPGDYWACAVHAATRPGPWRLVGPVACESDMDRSCERWQPAGLGRALVDGEGRASRLEQGPLPWLQGNPDHAPVWRRG